MPLDISLPPRDALPDLLGLLGIPESEVGEIVAAAPSPERDPHVWQRVQRFARRLVDDMGGFEELPELPPMPPEWGARGRYFYLYVFLAVLPHTRAYHRHRGIPDDIAWDTLAGLGGHVIGYRRTHEVGGMDGQDWLTLHFRGGIYRLGRLMFNRGQLDHLAPAVRATGLPYDERSPALGVHIPPGGGLTPEVCDASFQQAREFFATHFPEEDYRLARCGSWLLDNQLADYLPAGSNIVRFQRRFRLAEHWHDGDRDAWGAAFDAPAGTPLSELPRQTRLQRAVLDHLASGRHWRIRFGWLEL